MWEQLAKFFNNRQATSNPQVAANPATIPNQFMSGYAVAPQADIGDGPWSGYSNVPTSVETLPQADMNNSWGDLVSNLFNTQNMPQQPPSYYSGFEPENYVMDRASMDKNLALNPVNQLLPEFLRSGYNPDEWDKVDAGLPTDGTPLTEEQKKVVKQLKQGAKLTNPSLDVNSIKDEDWLRNMRLREKLLGENIENSKLMAQHFTPQLDLSMLASYVDNQTGSNLAKGYQKPKSGDQMMKEQQAMNMQQEKMANTIADDYFKNHLEDRKDARLKAQMDFSKAMQELKSKTKGFDFRGMKLRTDLQKSDEFKRVNKLSRLKRTTDRYMKTLAEFKNKGPEYWGANRAKLKSAYMDFLLSLKDDKYGLGVLNGKDLPVLQGAMPEFDKFQDLSSLLGGANYDTFMKIAYSVNKEVAQEMGQIKGQLDVAYAPAKQYVGDMLDFMGKTTSTANINLANEANNKKLRILNKIGVKDYTPFITGYGDLDLSSIKDQIQQAKKARK